MRNPIEHPTEVAEELGQIEKRLGELLPLPIQLRPEEVANLTEDQANLVHIAARRKLLFHLLAQETHFHVLDDCGDYLSAATDGWYAVFSQPWLDDFQGYADHIRRYLTDYEAYPEGGCDGEVRLDIIKLAEDDERLLSEVFPSVPNPVVSKTQVGSIPGWVIREYADGHYDATNGTAVTIGVHSILAAIDEVHKLTKED